MLDARFRGHDVNQSFPKCPMKIFFAFLENSIRIRRKTVNLSAGIGIAAYPLRAAIAARSHYDA